MSIEKIKQMVNENWESIDESFVGVLINDRSLLYLQKAPTEVWDGEYVERPRVFEDGALYPVITKNNIKTVARYFENTNSFLPESGHYNCDGDEFSFIGEKLPDSLWGDQS